MDHDAAALSAGAGMEEVEVRLMGGRAVRGIRCGRPGGDPWLFLHGWLDNAAAFIRMLPAFRDHAGPDIDLIAIDMAGHGRSDHRQGSYQLLDYAADILLVADALRWGNFSLVGHSLGGYAACLAAGTQPDRISRLVMLDIVGPNGRQAREAPEVLAKSVAWVAERSTGAKAGGSRLKVFPSLEEAARQRAEKNIGGPMTLSNAMLIASRGVVAENSGGTQAGFVWASDPRVLQPPQQELTPDSAMAFLHKIRCPTLVLVASDGIYREMLRRGSHPNTSVGGTGVPTTHAFGRPFCAFLFLCWAALSTITWLLAVPFPNHGRTLDAICKLLREGWRVGVRLHAVRRLRYEELRSGGHHFHMTTPDEAARAVARWLGRAGGGEACTSKR